MPYLRQYQFHPAMSLVYLFVIMLLLPALFLYFVGCSFWCLEILIASKLFPEDPYPEAELSQSMQFSGKTPPQPQIELAPLASDLGSWQLLVKRRRQSLKTSTLPGIGYAKSGLSDSFAYYQIGHQSRIYLRSPKTAMSPDLAEVLRDLQLNNIPSHHPLVSNGTLFLRKSLTEFGLSESASAVGGEISPYSRNQDEMGALPMDNG